MPPLSAAVGLAPVLCFLAALLALDSYKLVKVRMVLGVLVAGMAIAVIAYGVNGWILSQGIRFTAYTRYGAPFLEELLKGAAIVALARMNRVGFLVDAAILGFGVGAGFALVENLQYLRLFPDAGLGTWVVRGFGTALMHGGATAIFALMGLAMGERTKSRWLAWLPGYGIAVALHSAFNHFFLSPFASTVGIAIVLPPLLYLVFERSEKAVGRWLGQGFDADAEMLELINSGRLSDSPVGRYLHSLCGTFHGPVVADALCYLRLYTELALRAKGILILRENGFEAEADAETRAKFDEMAYLERSIGRTGLRALQPMLHMSHRDLWQLYMIRR